MSDDLEDTGAKAPSRYAAIIAAIFKQRYKQGRSSVEFDREDISAAAQLLGIRLPSNLGDLIYSYRYRVPLPAEVLKTAPEGRTWIIRPAGRGMYRLPS